MENDHSTTSFMPPPNLEDRNGNQRPRGAKPYLVLVGAVFIIALLLAIIWQNI